MTADANRESFIAAMSTLGMTLKQAAFRLGTPIDTIKNVRAHKTWERGVPDHFRAAVTKIVTEAERNGAHANAARTNDVDPIELPKDAAAPDESATTLDQLAKSVGKKPEGNAEAEGEMPQPEALSASEPAVVMGELLAAARALQETDARTAYATMKQAIRARVDVIGRDQLLRALGRSLNLTPKKMEARWLHCVTEVADEDFVPLTAEELAAREEAETRARGEAEARAKAEADALFARIGHIVKDPELLPRFVETVRRAGVVGEEQGIIATKLTIASRLLPVPASLLRKGAAASGKNTVIEKVLKLSREGDDYIAVSAASAKALVYMEEGFSHKTLYIAEAAAIAQRANGDEDQFAAMLRTAISEQRIIYHVTEQVEDEDGRKRFVTRRIEREGPVGLLMTTARENIEDELDTRLLTSHSDESVEQTRAVLTAAAARAMGQAVSPREDEIEEWRVFEDWLRPGAPYRVVVPFADKIASGALPNALRMRRDFSAVISLAMASAVLHKAQRRTDQEGRIVADLQDYAYAARAVLGDISASQAGAEIDTHAIAVGVYWLVDRAKRDFRLTQLAKLLAEGLAKDPACALAKPALARVSNSKKPSLLAVREALGAAKVVVDPATWRRCAWEARKALKDALTSNTLREPMNRRMSVAQLAAALGATKKVTRTRLQRALDDGVVVDDAAHLIGSHRTTVHVLRPDASFTISESVTRVRQALPSHEAIRAAVNDE